MGTDRRMIEEEIAAMARIWNGPRSPCPREDRDRLIDLDRLFDLCREYETLKRVTKSKQTPKEK